MFNHLKKLDVRDRTAWMDLPEVASNAQLHLRPIGEFNNDYVNALLKMSARRIRHAAKIDDLEITREENEQSRRDDKKLYPAYVIFEWEGIPDEDGKLVDYSEDNCLEFCEQLPNWIFDRVRAFASTPEKFLGREAVPDSQELVKNSESGSAGS